MKSDPDVLIVEDERPLSLAMAATVQRCGGNPTRVSNIAQARRAMRESTPAAIILDIGLPDGNGLQLLEEFPSLAPTLVVTAHGQIENAIAARKRGVHEFFDKPIDFETFRRSLTEILHQTKETDSPLAEEEKNVLPFIGAAPSMRSVFQKVAHACASREPVLITGETGTGKTMVAKLIAREEVHTHHLSSIEWSSYDPGKSAANSNLCLIVDPITRLDAVEQEALLGILSREASTPQRILATAGTGLREQVQSGAFSSALYYRLQVLEIRLPLLRERKVDIPALATYFLGQITGDNVEISRESLAALVEYPWPGNLRELKNVLAYANTIRGRSPSIQRDHLPEHLVEKHVSRGGNEQLLSSAIDDWLGEISDLPDYKTLSGELEALLIRRLLARFDNKLAPMARALKANRTTLRKKIHGPEQDSQ